MGRHYGGNITGKFWFSSQPSNDIENLCSAKPEKIYICGVCGVEMDDTVCDECGENEDYESQSYSLRYELLKDIHEHEIKETLLRIESIIDTSNLNITYYEEDDTTYYEINNDTYEINNDTNTLRSPALVARYCLGNQILWWFREHDVCCVECEV